MPLTVALLNPSEAPARCQAKEGSCFRRNMVEGLTFIAAHLLRMQEPCRPPAQGRGESNPFFCGNTVTQ